MSQNNATSRTLEDVMNDAKARATRAREAQKRERRAQERAQTHDQIREGQARLTENAVIDRQIADLKRIPDWASDPEIIASVEELEVLRTANAEELAALGDNADIALYNLRKDAFGTWVPDPSSEEGKNIFAPNIHDVRALSPALHRLLEVTDHETVDESPVDLTERVNALLTEISTQIESIRSKKNEVPEKLLEAQRQLAALDPTTLRSEMELFNTVPYLSNQTMRCMCPLNGCGNVTHSVTVNGETREFRGRVFRFKGYVRSKSLRSATTAVRLTDKHIKELNKEARDALDSWIERSNLSTWEEAIFDRVNGIKAGPAVMRRPLYEDQQPGRNETLVVEYDRRYAQYQATVVISVDTFGTLTVEAADPKATRYLTVRDPDTGVMESIVGKSFPKGEQIPRHIWVRLSHLRDVDPMNQLRTAHVSVDPGFSEPTLETSARLSRPSSQGKRLGEDHRRTRRNHDSGYAQSVRNRSRHGQDDED